MVRGRPAFVYRRPEFHRLHDDLGEFGILGPDQLVLQLAVLLERHLFRRRRRLAVGIRVPHPHQQAGVLALRAALERKLLDAGAEFEDSRGAVRHVNFGHGARGSLRVRTVAERDMHSRIGRSGRTLGARRDPQNEFALVRELRHASGECARPPQAVRPIHGLDLVDDRFLGAMLEHRRCRTSDDCPAETVARCSQIVLHEQGRHAQRRAVVGEAVAARLIGGKVLDVVNIQTQQVAHRVLVLDTVQATHHRARGLAGMLGIGESRVQPIKQNRPVFRGEIRGVAGRHAAAVQGVADVMPLLGCSSVVPEVHWQIVQTHSGVLH